MAPDDGTVAAVRPRRRSHGLPAFGCADFYPDDPVEDWEVPLVRGYGIGPACGGAVMVFEVPERLRSALASRGRLVEVAAQWVELAGAKDGAPAEAAVEILTEVADLARTAGDLGQPLYCWYFAP